MKRLFFLLPVLFFLKASTQEPYYDFKKIKEQNHRMLLQPNRSLPKDSLQKVLEKIRQAQKMQFTGVLLFSQPNGTRVYGLPQDNMICLVPNMAQFNMPVVGTGTKITGMPPSSVPPYNIIPEK